MAYRTFVKVGFGSNGQTGSREGRNDFDPPFCRVPSGYNHGMADSITISTGSRLHFGLSAFGGVGSRQFGGVGAMVDVPLAIHVALDKISGALQPARADGRELHGRAVEKFVDLWFENRLKRGGDFEGQLLRNKVKFRVTAAPDHHVGLGLGTQLGLATSMALFRVIEKRSPSLVECAAAVGRGLRSAVGTYGFFYGGLIVDQGKQAEEDVSPLQCRLSIPDCWRWVLMRMPIEEGLSGAEEIAAFEQLGAMSSAQTKALRAKISDELLPALKNENYEIFSESLYEYGRDAGACFAAIQGGPYRNQGIADLIDQVRSLGVRGVGQSSWGPTVFALLENEKSAVRLTQDLHTSKFGRKGLTCSVVSSKNEGFSDQTYAFD